MGTEPGDWTINSKLAELDPQLARLLEVQHFKPINPDAVAQSDVAKSAVESYVSAIVLLAQTGMLMQTVARAPGNFESM